MKKNTLFKNLAYVIIGIIFAVGVSYIYADSTYNDPSGNPPVGNPSAPLNVGTTDQIKPNDSCTSDSCGGLSLLGSFVANQAAAFNKQVFFNGMMLGGTVNNGAVADGPIAFGTSANPTSLTVTGDMSTSDAMQSDTLKNSAGNASLCANAAGQVVFCGSTDICSNIAGNQTSVPAGDNLNSDGTCTPPMREFYSVNVDSLGAQPFVGSITDGDVPSTAKELNTTEDGGNAPGTVMISGWPLVATSGIANDDPNGWQKNGIFGVLGTDFDNTSGNTRLLNVYQKGSYNFSLKGAGSIGIKAKSDGGSDNNYINVFFLMKVSYADHSPDQWYLLKNGNSTQAPTQAILLPNSTLTPTETSASAQNIYGGSWGFGGTGTQWKYGNYSYNFNKTLDLNPGDSVDVYTYVYGVSTYSGFFDDDGYSNFFYSINTDPGQTIFDIKETPE